MTTPSKGALAKSKTNSKVLTKAPAINSCQRVSIDQLENAKQTKYKIPLIIHQVYCNKHKQIPVQYHPLISGCQKMNPEFLYVIWTDEEVDHLMNTKLPQYKNLYTYYQANVQKSDFLRYLLLYYFGGVYFDMDVECHLPFINNIDNFNSSAIADQERRLQTRILWNRNFTVMTTTMISRKGHPFFKYLLDKLPENTKHSNVMWRTGPFYLHERFMEYNRHKHSPMDSVHLASEYAFSPLLDPSILGLFSGRCTGDYKTKTDAVRRGCIEWDAQKRVQDAPYIKKVTKNSLLIHKFMHLAYSDNSVKARTELCTIKGISKLEIKK